MSNNTRLEKFINAGIQSHYVFYDRLKEDGYGDIYTKAKNMVDNAQGLSTVIPSSDSAALYAMAEAELKKEKEMLSRTFGCDFQQKNIEDPAFYTELIQPAKLYKITHIPKPAGRKHAVTAHSAELAELQRC